MFTFRIVLVSGEKMYFDNVIDAMEYMDKNNLIIEYSDDNTGYWAFEGGGEMTRVD